jgi:hypothetical protein
MLSMWFCSMLPSRLSSGWFSISVGLCELTCPGGMPFGHAHMLALYPSPSAASPAVQYGTKRLFAAATRLILHIVCLMAVARYLGKTCLDYRKPGQSLP